MRVFLARLALPRLAIRPQGRPIRVHNTRTEQEGTFELYKKAAEQGIAEAQFNLGLMYYHGENYNVAFKWFKKAAKQGHVDAQFNVGLMCYGIHENYTKAFEWFKKAAEQGHVGAQYTRTEQGHVSAQYTRTFAEHGIAEAQYELGKMYYDREGTVQNYNVAFKWFKKAA